jgi:PAS domain S-box-containing protein
LDRSDGAIITKTPEGTITSWDRGATRILGFDPDEAIGRHITMLFPRERLPEEDELRARIARGEPVDDFRTQRVRRDGTTVNVSITLAPVRDQSGRLVSVTETVRDLAPHGSLEAEADEQAALFRIMADTAPVMIWMSGPDTLCT